MKKQLLSIVVLLTTFFSFGQVPASEKNALIALYNSTDGASWTTNTNWNTASPVSSWYGITVENIAGQDHVTKIDFGYSSNNLNGTLPTEIGDLSEITNITINFNDQLTGSIPTQIGNLSKLTTLSFWNNNLNGTIPSELGNCTNLETLSLEDNQLTGNIPANFANLTAMKSFWINGNYLSGNIPSFFSSWTSLDFFSIGNGNNTAEAHNDFTGSLDLSSNNSLRLCWIDNTMISSLNIKNGNNTNTTNSYFNAANNPNLTCIFVDDATYSTTNWTSVDATATFVETQAACDALSVSDLSFKQKITLYPNPTLGTLHVRNSANLVINKITITNTLGQKIINCQDENNIDLSTLPNGIYYVNIENTKGDKAIYKIIKE